MIVILRILFLIVIFDNLRGPPEEIDRDIYTDRVRGDTIICRNPPPFKTLKALPGILVSKSEKQAQKDLNWLILRKCSFNCSRKQKLGIQTKNYIQNNFSPNLSG